MQKKLTDEEIVQDMIDHKNAAENYSFVQITGKQMSRWLDIIHRLQDEVKEKKRWYDIARDELFKQKAEIERLTEENRKLNNEWDNTTKYCAELQKQVDELLNRRIEPKIFHCHADVLETCPKVEQTVKNTAREILQELIEKAYSSGCIDLNVNEVKAWFREDYGVEVDE